MTNSLPGVGAFLAAHRYAAALLATAFLCAQSAPAQQQALLSVGATAAGELVAAIQPGFHAQYGCTYPLTYQFDLTASQGAGLKAWRKYHAGDPYALLTEKKSGQSFNALEAVRFDLPSGRAYVSASFEGESDSLFIEITDSTGTPVPVLYRGISRYYDNRQAVVTVTADDWADWTEGWYPSLLGIFRNHGLYVTAGVISGTTNTNFFTWRGIQNQVNLGNVEIAAHSRTHTHVPYAQPDSEVLGCARDIKMLSLPPLFSSRGTGYVYVWLAPYGDFDASTDSLMGVGHYLVARLYTYAQAPMSPWVNATGHFAPVNPTLELGAPSWGGGDTNIASLNGTFDAIAAQGGVYHLMWHPQVIITDTASPYFVNHLGYISNRPDIWYVNLGHLYLYHMIQEVNDAGLSAVRVTGLSPASCWLGRNYPNPFNPTTTIPFFVPHESHVTITVYNALGQLVKTLMDGDAKEGVHDVKFEGGGLASGVYFCRMEAGRFVATTKLMVLR
ncbi:MAG TPA: T9SS type A sorting domain-containing protein [Bacteroidota bacterium]|nr:T9SS type A sorting domain-containing protein [Bacteroidota bacterium]